MAVNVVMAISEQPDKQEKPRRLGSMSRWPVLKRHWRALKVERSGLNLIALIAPVIAMIVTAGVIWSIGQGFFRKPAVMEVDYSKLFMGEARRLEDGRAEILYNFAPKPDGFVEYPQLQDWSYDNGVYEGWLMGQASLRAAFTKEVEMSFDFQLLTGTNIMPAVGVRDKGLTRLAVMIEREGRVSVWKFLEGLPVKIHEVQTTLSFQPREIHNVQIKAATTYPDEATETTPVEMPPEQTIRLPDQVMNHPPLPEPEKPAEKGPTPHTDITVIVDGKRLIDCRVEKYVLDGWVMLDAWSSTALFNNVKIAGLLYPEWLASELIVKKKLSAIKEK